MNDHIDEYSIGPDENTFHAPIITPGVLNNLDGPRTQIYDSEDNSAGLDSDTFLSMLFHPPFEPSTTTPNFINHTQDYSENGQIHPLVNACTLSVPDGDLTLQPTGQVRAALKVQNSWPASVRPPGRPNLWREVALTSMGNIFDSQHTVKDTLHIDTVAVDDSSLSEINLGYATRERLRALKQNILICDCSNLFDNDTTCNRRYLCRNNMEVFDQGFYLYTHKYQPAYPVAHLGTFNPEKVSDILLFSMCMIGVSLLKTEDAMTFIRMTYPVRKP